MYNVDKWQGTWFKHFLHFFHNNWNCRWTETYSKYI